MNIEKFEYIIKEKEAFDTLRHCIESIKQIDTWDKEKLQKITTELYKHFGRVYGYGFYDGADYVVNNGNKSLEK